MDCIYIFTVAFYARETYFENVSREKRPNDKDGTLVIYLMPEHHLRIIIFTNPSAWAGCDTRSIFKRSLKALNSEFSFSSTICLTKADEPCLPYYLPISWGRIIGFIPFPRVLVLCEMQLVSARIWTRVHFLRR